MEGILPVVADIWMFQTFWRKTLKCDADADTDADVKVTTIAFYTFEQVN